MATGGGAGSIGGLADQMAKASITDFVDPKSSFDRDSFSLRKVELIRTVGTGTFGRVMVVRDKESNTFYALKILIIEDVIRLKQVEHVKAEKAILDQVGHPFLVSMFWSNHDRKFLYMLFEFVCGGEVFTYLRNCGRFTNNAVVFYTAEIFTALEYLHSLHIAYRDMKPENLLLDAEGHVKITDFGFAKIIMDKTYTMCGTPEYLAPEIIHGKGYSKDVDWWSLGILIYEMLFGQPPFCDDNPMQIYQKILGAKVEFPRTVNVEPAAKDIIKRFLVLDRTRRIGCMKNGSTEIKNHVWFKSLNWSDVVQRKLKPPIIPKVKSPGDTQCFDHYDELDWKKIPAAAPASLEHFKDF